MKLSLINNSTNNHSKVLLARNGKPTPTSGSPPNKLLFFPVPDLEFELLPPVVKLCPAALLGPVLVFICILNHSSEKSSFILKHKVIK